MQTNSIVLGAADGAGDGLGPTIPSFAAARKFGIYSVAGSAKAALALSFDLGDFLSNATGHVPLRLGGAGRQLQAALSLQAGGKLSLDVGSSFGFVLLRRARPAGRRPLLQHQCASRVKHAQLRWRYTFF